MKLTGNDSENKATNATGNGRKCRRNDNQNHGAHQRGHRINIRLPGARNVRENKSSAKKQSAQHEIRFRKTLVRRRYCRNVSESSRATTIKSLGQKEKAGRLPPLTHAPGDGA